MTPQVFAVPVAILLLRNRRYMHVIVEELCRHGLDRDYVIDKAGGDGAARHSKQSRGVALRLRYREAAKLLDCPDADGAVAADTRKHDANCALPAVFSQ